MKEAFLINPLLSNRRRRRSKASPRFATNRRRRKVSMHNSFTAANRRRRRASMFGRSVNRKRPRFLSSGARPRRRISRNPRGLPSQLFKRVMREHGVTSKPSAMKGALKEAWKQYKKGIRKNPLGEEVIIVGANPRRRRRNSIMATNRKRKRNRVRRRRNRVRRRRNPILMNRPRRRRRRNAVLTNPRRRRRNAVLANRPRRRRRNAVLANRRRRRNPAGIGAIVSQTTSVLPLVATGTVSGIATYTIPRLLKTTGYVTYGVQAAVIMGGGWLINKQFGREHSKAWIIGGASALLATMLQGVVSKTLALAGIDLGREEYAAFPQEYAAFPQEYEGVGNEEYADAYFGQEDEEEIAY